MTYVCIGDDPTYTKVKRPVFLLCDDVVTYVSKNKMRIAFIDGTETMARYFTERTAIRGDQKSLDQIVKHLANKQAETYEFQSHPHHWLPGTMSKEKLDTMKRVAEMFRKGQYEVKIATQ